jgi:hypothetical protein
VARAHGGGRRRLRREGLWARRLRRRAGETAQSSLRGARGGAVTGGIATARARGGGRRRAAAWARSSGGELPPSSLWRERSGGCPVRR